MNALRDTLTQAPVAVLGNGVSGCAAAELLHENGCTARIFDQSGGPGVETHFDAAVADGCSAIVVSPGIAADHPWVLAALDVDRPILGEMDLGAIFWPGKLLAVTGTNGKTTLTALIAALLNAVGQEAEAAGNIGRPLCSLARRKFSASTVAVCEVSSFQAEIASVFRPDWVLWTNFAEDHLDRHRTMWDYFRAKARLLDTGAKLIAGPSVAHYAAAFDWPLPSGTLVAPSIAGPAGSVFAKPPQSENYALAAIFAEQNGLPLAALEAVAQTFRLAPHRLDQVADHLGVRFWDDSKATNFHAALAALRGFEEPVHWIGGGKSKGGDLLTFAREIAPHLQSASLIGETAPALAEYLRACGVERVKVCGSLEGAVETAYAEAWEPVDIVFSPGFSSQDQFTNYRERGNRFARAVLGLKPAAPRPISKPCA